MTSSSAFSAPPDLVALYKDLHAHPELAFQEHRTAGLLAAQARNAGFDVTEGVGGTGIVAVLKNGPGPVLLIRTDMDALPVREATGLAYARIVNTRLSSGDETYVMHACGHDIHMTAWVGLARELAKRRSEWKGTLVMIGQPAEEIVSGASAMIKDGLYTRFPKPDHALAFHDSAALPAGEVAVPTGYVLANVDSVDILVKGVGSHGSEPQNGIDPIVVASRIVTTLQTIVSREVDPQLAAVVTVGVFQAGTKRNIISDKALLQLTVRTYDQPVREQVLAAIARVAKAEAQAAGTPDSLLPEISFAESSDATFNTPGQTPRVHAAIVTALGAERVKSLKPSMAAEDFGQFSKGFPGVESTMFWVGAQPRAVYDAAKGDPRKMPGLHSAHFAPDPEPTIATAIEAMTAASLALLGK